jgi:cytochrome b6-f complex iron-sulfur subunit
MGFVRYMFPRVLFEPPTTFKAGSPEEYAPGVVHEKFKKDRRVWIVRHEDGSFYALLAICTHLGVYPLRCPSPRDLQPRGRLSTIGPYVRKCPKA